MMNNTLNTRKNNFQIIFKLYKFLSPRRKSQLLIMLFLVLLGGLADAFSIAAVIPFLSVLTNPESLWKFEFIKRISLFFGYQDPNDLIIPSTALFALSALLASIARISNLWLSGIFSAKIGNDISYEAYKRTLEQPYEVHINRNSSEIINTLTLHMNQTIDVINYILLFSSSVIIVLFIVIGLIIVDWLIASTSAIVFVSAYGFTILFLRMRLLKLSKTIADTSQSHVKYVQEGLGGIRDILIDETNETFINAYQKVDQKMRIALAFGRIFAGTPRYIIEGIGMIFISSIALFLTLKENNNLGVVPLLGTLALGTQRLLPAMQQGYNAWVHIKTDLEGFKKVIALLSQPKIKTIIKNSQDIKFTEKISVKNLSFRYSGENHLVLNKVNFVIKKGERIGIIGETGSGKSTLTDLLLGLLKPTNGSIFIDDVELNTSINSQNLSSWKKILAHVPQSIYLADRNIFENIAFGVQTDQIDINKIYYAAKQAQIHDFILRLPNGYKTFVGERGVKLSGGQRQRIGIARAIYKGAKVLFLMKRQCSA